MVPPAQTSLTEDVPTVAREIETDGPVAAAMRPVIEGSFGSTIPIRFEFWDGSRLNPPDQTVATLKFSSPDAIRRLLWMPNELGLGRGRGGRGRPRRRSLRCGHGIPRCEARGRQRRTGVEGAPRRSRRCEEDRRIGPTTPSAAGGSTAPWLAPHVEARCRCDRSPLRRRQRLLSSRARSDDDLFVSRGSRSPTSRSRTHRPPNTT